eukprot:PITA_22823
MSAFRFSLWSAFAFQGSLLVCVWAIGDKITSSGAQKVSTVLCFGDSYVDPGNNNHIPTLIKSDFLPYGTNFVERYPTGRFSDGKILPDYLGLGIKELLPAYLDPNLQDQDLITGVSFASSGSGLDNLTAASLSVIPFWKEIEYFKEYRSRLATLVGGIEKAAMVLNSAVAFISIGTNDFIANYFLEPIRPSHFTVSQYIDFLLRTLSGYIEELYSLDVRRIGVINLPPLGCLPVEKTLRIKVEGECAEELNEAAAEFNEKLISTIDRLKPKLPGLRIVSLNYYDNVLDAVKDPAKYGFEVTGRSCCGTGSIEFGYLCNEATPFTCSDASKYVFFDSIHLTQKSYAIISQAFLNEGISQLW